MKVRVFLSAFCGLLFGFMGYFVMRWVVPELALPLAAACGFLFAVLLYGYLAVHNWLVAKRYADFEKGITSPVFYKTNGNFDLGNGKVKNGNIYFCEAGIVCVSLEEMPYTLDEILLPDIDSYQCDDIHLNIFANDGRVFVITMPDVRKVMDILLEKGWIS